MMDILKDYTDAQVLALADQPTPEPMAGTWTLVRPDGRHFYGANPMQCLRTESADRILPLQALARIRRSVIEEREAKLGKAFDTLPDDYECPH